MEAQTIFYIGGGLLVVAALLISFVGIRGKDAFPPSGGVMTAGVAVFAVLVAGTAAYAVASAREEQEHRDEELAEAEVEAEEGVSQAEAESEPEEGTQEGEPPPIGQQTPSAEPKAQVDLTSPEDGSLEFEPGAIQTKPGQLTVVYDNPSPVSHNVAVEDEQAELLGTSETIAQAATELTLDMVPGEYIYFCAVPGHREGGMEGTLIVQ